MRFIIGSFFLLLGVLLVFFSVLASFELTDMATAASGPELDQLSAPTQFLFKFFPSASLPATATGSPADLIAAFNKVIYTVAGVGVFFVFCGGAVLWGQRSRGSEDSSTD